MKIALVVVDVIFYKKIEVFFLSILSKLKMSGEAMMTPISEYNARAVVLNEKGNAICLSGNCSLISIPSEGPIRYNIGKGRKLMGIIVVDKFYLGSIGCVGGNMTTDQIMKYIGDKDFIIFKDGKFGCSNEDLASIYKDIEDEEVNYQHPNMLTKDVLKNIIDEFINEEQSTKTD